MQSPPKTRRDLHRWDRRLSDQSGEPFCSASACAAGEVDCLTRFTHIGGLPAHEVPLRQAVTSASVLGSRTAFTCTTCAMRATTRQPLQCQHASLARPQDLYTYR